LGLKGRDRHQLRMGNIGGGNPKKKKKRREKSSDSVKKQWSMTIGCLNVTAETWMYVLLASLVTVIGYALRFRWTSFRTFFSLQ